MKAVLVFKLPEESEDHLDALRGSALKWGVNEFDQWLRHMSKYEDKTEVNIDEARDKLREFTSGID